MNRNLLEIRQEEAFYHSTHYQQYTIDSKDSWLGYPVKKLVDLGITIATNNVTPYFLDLGCGVGRNAIPIAETNPEGVQIDCVDILPAAIDSFSSYAKQSQLPSFNFFLSDVQDFHFEPAKYDYIFSVSTLEHLANKAQFIRVLNAIKDATTDYGYVYLIINSEVSEFLLDEQRYITPYLELNLTTDEIIEILTDIFNCWKILDKEIKPLSYEIERSIGNTNMTTNALTFIAQNIREPKKESI